MLYRIAQELVNNAIKHADCKNIHINFTTLVANTILVVTDDGKGFDVKQANSRTNRGLGLQGIEGRVRVINATVRYQTTMGAGCRATINVHIDS